MKYTITQSPPKLSVDIDMSVDSTLKTFKEEVFDRLTEIYDTHKPTRLLLSDGMDSKFLALCLLELKIPFTPLSFIFSTNENEVTRDITAFCNSKNLDARFFVIEENKLFEHIEKVTYEKKTAYTTLNGYYHDYVLTEYADIFWCGQQNEFRYYDDQFLTSARVSPVMIQKNFPNRTFGYDTSRVFLSYINHFIFKDNFNRITERRPNIDEYYIRNLIYKNTYPNLTIKEKSPWFDDPIAVRFYNMLPEIKKEVPWVFELEVCKFDVHEYFDNKS